MKHMSEALLLIVAGYLVGSMPFGYWLVRLRHGEDIRRHGSGNIGATNVWRNFGALSGVPIALLDVVKGFVPAVLGMVLVGPLVGVLAGAAAMLGHWRPLFLRLHKGGKMVATCGGAVIGLAPLVALVGVGVWIALFLATRYASIASMTAAVALPVCAILLGQPLSVVIFVSASALGVIVLHRPNISRLLAGKEHRFHLWRRWRRGGSGRKRRPSVSSPQARTR